MPETLVRFLSRYADAGDVGLGDTLERLLAWARVDAPWRAALRYLGLEDCGCPQRRALLNQRFPYP